MSLIDPSLDRSRGAAGMAQEGRELAMFRHDVRSALMGVLGGAGQIEAAEPGADVLVQVQRVAAASRNLACLVGAMLGEELDPAEADSAARVETEALLAHLRRRYAGEAAERGLRFTVESGERVPAALKVARIALVRILANLVGNAIKFSDAGTVRLSVSRGADGSVFFRVSDDGPGLADAGGAPSPRAGQGLGLEIVRVLAERIGAEAGVSNRPGGGAEAMLRLPAEMADERATLAPQPAAASGLAGIRVLLAEDNPTNQMVASQMLRALDAEVTVCGDGVEALERFEAQPVDLVVVDIEMPRLSGLDVIRAIRARGDERAQVPIVALTAYAMREHRERIAAAGANGLISKPVTSIAEFGRGLAAYVAAPQAAPDMPDEAAANGADADAGGPLIDHAVYDALVAAIGAETMRELLEKVEADLLSAQADLARALPEVDRAPIRAASHILISVAGAVGAVRLQTCARDLNALAHTEATDRIAATTRRCIAEIDRAAAFARGRRSMA